MKTNFTNLLKKLLVLSLALAAALSRPSSVGAMADAPLCAMSGSIQDRAAGVNDAHMLLEEVRKRATVSVCADANCTGAHAGATCRCCCCRVSVAAAIKLEDKGLICCCCNVLRKLCCWPRS